MNDSNKALSQGLTSVEEEVHADILVLHAGTLDLDQAYGCTIDLDRAMQKRLSSPDQPRASKPPGLELTAS